MKNTKLKLPWDGPVVSLRELSLIKVATILWSNEDVMAAIMECQLPQRLVNRLQIKKGEQWEKVQAIAKKIISNICICAKLKEDLIELLWPLTNRILLWKSTYAPRLDDEFFHQFYWTDRGKVDSVRTAKCIIANKEISIRKRFILACSMCLKEEIHEVWKAMSRDDLLYIFEDNEEYTRPLILFWVKILEGTRNDGRFKPCVVNALQCGILLRLLEAVKYLYSFFTTSSNNNIGLLCLNVLNINLLDSFFLEEHEIDIGLFILSQMSAQLKSVALNTHYALALTLLLHSSDRRQFYEVWMEILESIDPCFASIFLSILFHMYHLGISKENDYRKLFINVWRTMPYSLQSPVSNLHTGLHCLCTLLRDFFPFILTDLTIEQPTKSTSPDFNPVDFFKQFSINQERWNFLLFLIKEDVVTIPPWNENSDFGRRLLGDTQKNKTRWERLRTFINKMK